VTKSEAVADDQHLFREFSPFCKGVEERKRATDKGKDHGAVDKPSSE